MHVRYQEVRKQFGAFEALHPLDLTVADGEFLALLGPSGCGKTTTLRLLAGLETPTAGSIHIGETDVTRLAPKERDIAMVFQNYALYPHMTVAENVAYPLKLRKVPSATREEVVRRAAESLNLADKLDCRPKQLSGGQRQRVALARAIVRHPSVFLMDEPLSNLDAILRVQMRGELKRLQKDLGVTTLYVTHDQSEAMTMADRVAVMRGGRLEQLAPPREVYECPANTFVASFVGSPPMNLLPAAWESGALRVDGTAERFALAERLATWARERTGDGELFLGVRPEHVEVLDDEEPGGVAAEIFAVQPLDHEVLVTFSVGEHRLTGRFPVERRFAMGAPARIALVEDHIHLFDRGSGRNLASTAKWAAAGAAAKADLAHDTVR